MNPAGAIMSDTTSIRATGGFSPRPVGLIRVTGPEAASFLKGQITNSIVERPVGDGCYSAMCDGKGKMQAEFRVLKTAEAILLLVDPARTEFLLQRLDQFHFAEAVEFANDSDAWTGISLVGPRAWTVLATLSSDAPAELPPHQHAFCTLQDGHRLLAIGHWGTGLPGVDLLAAVPPVGAGFKPAPTKALLDVSAKAAVGRVAAGAALVGLAPITDADWEALRIEAGIPKFGVDADTDTFPLEVGLEAYLDFTQGCFSGAEVLQRILYRGHVNRKLCGLKFEAPSAPPAGSPVLIEGREVGRVTSAATTTAAGAIGLAMVKWPHYEPGQSLTVVADGGSLRANTAALPFIAL